MDYEVKPEGMRSGMGEQASRVYKMYMGKSGRRWLVADQPNAGDNVYVEGGDKSDGFGGATLTFKLINREEVKLKGPWHSNSDALYADTEIDLREQHETFIVIGTGREYNQSNLSDYITIIKNVLYIDEFPTIGSFYRGKELAQDFADDMEIPIVCYSRSRGGSSCGWHWPKGTVERDWEYDKQEKKWMRKNNATQTI